jgi:hypothetical protein
MKDLLYHRKCLLLQGVWTPSQYALNPTPIIDDACTAQHYFEDKSWDRDGTSVTCATS